MKFIVSSSVLLRSLSHLTPVVPGSPLVPILGNFLFRVETGLLEVTASDLQTTITTSLPVDATEAGSVCVPAKLLTGLLGVLAEQPITVSIDPDAYVVRLQSDNGAYRIVGENPANFPSAPKLADPVTLTLPAPMLLSGLSVTAFCTSTDGLRPAMTGVCMHQGGLVATDGHRVGMYLSEGFSVLGETTVIVPRKPLDLLRGHLADAGEVNIEINNLRTQARFVIGGLTIITRLVDERFPDFQNAIPQHNDRELIVGRTDFIASLKRIFLFTNRETLLIRLSMMGNKLTLSAEDLNMDNEGTENLLCDYDGDPLEIGFNAKLLLDLLAHLPARLVKLTFSQPNRAAMLYPADGAEPGGSVEMLIMPVALTNHIAHA